AFLLTLFSSYKGRLLLWLGHREKATQKRIESAEKALNDKRDFNHLVNNQSQISTGIATGFEDLENHIRELENQVREIKAYLIRNHHKDDKL
ncbi:MAG: hypothetical protein ACYTX0_26660, partial [Nostoc sp.]